ncbi:MAG: O-antigen ligase family protein [bacterium]|nr:O-antigen ligase family protein [bacterium]
MADTMTDRLARVFPYLLIAPAILPLVYVSGVVYPYITPKTFLLQGLGIIALAAFSYLALSGRPFFYGRLRNRLTWIPAALLSVAYVTSIFGIDFYRSFWGLFDRGDGLLTLTVITTFFYLILISADRQLLERLVKVIAVVAGIVAAIAVLQWLTTILGGKAWFLPPVTGRIGSTFGNAAFLAGYLGMALFVILLVLRDAVGTWRRIYIAAAILSVLAIVLAATRGTILALFMTGVVGLMFVALKGAGEWKRFARYGLVVIVVLAGLFFVFRVQLAQSSFEPVKRIASISLSDGTVASRLFVWQNLSAEALKRPWSGYGTEHVARLFDRVYDPSKIVEQWFDRSHNAFLDYFAQYGVFGLALYLALIIAFAASALKLYRREPAGLMNPGMLFLLLILTYAMQNFFVFDTPHSLWLLYALFSALLVLQDDSSPASFSRTQMPAFVPALTSGIILLAIIPTVLFPLYANILLTKGYLLHLVDVNKANAYFEKGLSLNTYADLEYGYQAYDMYTAHQVVQLTGDDLVTGYQFALSLLTENFKKYPYDARTATYLGHVIDTAPQGIAVDDSFDRLVLDRAIELSPLRAQAWYMTTNILLRKAEVLPVGSKEREPYYREAIKILETYAAKEPLLPVPRYILATLYYALDDKVVAKKWADEALPLYTEADVAAARPAVKYYIAIGDWQHAVRFLADLVEDNPSDYDVLYDLAKVTYLVGDPAASLRIVEKLRTDNPEILPTDQNFLNAITAYEQSKK